MFYLTEKNNLGIELSQYKLFEKVMANRSDPRLMEAKNYDRNELMFLKDVISNFAFDKQHTYYNPTNANCHMYSCAIWKYVFPESDGTEFD